MTCEAFALRATSWCSRVTYFWFCFQESLLLWNRNRIILTTCKTSALSSLQVHRTKEIHWYFKDETQYTDFAWKEFSFSLDWAVDFVGKRNTGLLECQGVRTLLCHGQTWEEPWTFISLCSSFVCLLVLFWCVYGDTASLKSNSWLGVQESLAWGSGVHGFVWDTL